MTRSQKRQSRHLLRVLKDKLLYWYRLRAEIAEVAHRMRQQADSWRGFDVGSAGVGVLENGELWQFTGYNVKKAEGPRQEGDHCAEPDMIEEAERNGCTEIFGIATEAPYQPDDFTGRDLGVTTMCVHCRRYLRSKLKDPRSAVKKDTRLFFVNGEDRSKQIELTVENLLRLHSDDE